MQVTWFADWTLPQAGHFRTVERATWQLVHSTKCGGNVELQLMQIAMGSAPGAHMLPAGGTRGDLGESFVGALMGRARRSLIRG